MVYINTVDLFVHGGPLSIVVNGKVFWDLPQTPTFLHTPSESLSILGCLVYFRQKRNKVSRYP